MGINVSVIFETRPIQWGWRGDPFLWDEMKTYFETKKLPYTKGQFMDDFYFFFKLVTGDELGSSNKSYVERFAKVGMSKGLISHEFWIEKGLPLLCSRLDAANKDCAK